MRNVRTNVCFHNSQSLFKRLNDIKGKTINKNGLRLFRRICQYGKIYYIRLEECTDILGRLQNKMGIMVCAKAEHLFKAELCNGNRTLRYIVFKHKYIVKNIKYHDSACPERKLRENSVETINAIVHSNDEIQKCYILIRLQCLSHAGGQCKGW